MHKILMVEDDKKTAAYIAAILSSEAYVVLKAFNGKSGVSMAASHMPDLILLDLGLPDIDGVEVLKHIREWSDLPVIVVSARQAEHEKVKALDCGANDYITKPFGASEFLARIRAALRTHHKDRGPSKESVFQTGGLRIDFAKRMISVDGRPIHLTPAEYKIVVFLAQNAGKVVTHDLLLSNIWGPYAPDNQLLRVNVANIRRKIEEDPADPHYIVTEIGVGYKMIGQDAE